MEDGLVRDLHVGESQCPVMTADDADRDTTYTGSENILQIWSTWTHKEDSLSHIETCASRCSELAQSPIRHDWVQVGVPVPTADSDDQQACRHPHQHQDNSEGLVDKRVLFLDDSTNAQAKGGGE